MKQLITRSSPVRGLRETFRNLRKDQSGVTLYEYAVILGFFSVAACMCLVSLDRTVNTTLQVHSDTMSQYNQNYTLPSNQTILN